MPQVLVIAEVENLEEWERGFRTHSDLFRQMGVSRMEFGTGPGNRIAVAGDTNNLDAYMKILVRRQLRRRWRLMVSSAKPSSCSCSTKN
jgi:hypothetical protein